MSRWGLCGVVVMLMGGTAEAGDPHLPYQGRVLDTFGLAISGTHNATVSLYSDPAGTTDAWSKTYVGTDFADGYFAVELSGTDDTTRALEDALGSPLWVGVSVGAGSDLLPVQRLTEWTSGSSSEPTLGAKVYLSSNQSIPDAAVTTIAFDQEFFDHSGVFDVGTSRYTPGMTGLYSITASARYNAASNGSRIGVRIFMNGNNVGTNEAMASNVHNPFVQVSGLFEVTDIDDYFEIRTYHYEYGAARSLVSASSETNASFYRVGPIP